MTRMSIDPPVQGTRNSKLVGNLVTIEEGVVAEDEAPTPVSLNQEATSTINGNYHSCPTSSVKVLQRLDKNLLQKNLQTVRSNVLDSSGLNVAKCQIHKQGLQQV